MTLFLLHHQGKGHCELGAHANDRLDTDVAAHGLRESLADREAKAHTLGIQLSMSPYLSEGRE